MYDTTTPAELANLVGSLANSILITAGSAFDAIKLANDQLDAGETDRAINTMRNARAAANTYKSIQTMIDAAAPRTGDKPDGGMG